LLKISNKESPLFDWKNLINIP